mmetsp:Transcript_14766/g.33578  ORF Transcript_14766/g.33578 Transcript_14766/m.33578 type:complete len:938 (+) Transcript_14766:72-2885(+)
MSSQDASWDIAWESWAEDADCSSLVVDQEAEFNRIWLACATFGFSMVLLITLPRFLCADADKESGEALSLVKKLKSWHASSANSQKDLNTTQGTHVSNPGSPSARSAYEDEDAKPDVQKAREHLKEVTPHDENGHYYGIIFAGRKAMRSVGGTGLDCYFTMLRHLGYVFCYLTIFSAPLLCFSYYGNFVPDIGSALARTSIGNLGYITKGGVDQEYRQVIVGCASKPLSDLTPIFGWLDFVNLMIYFGFAVWLRWWHVPRAAVKSDNQMVTVADFAVEIECLPRRIDNHSDYKERLQAHLGKAVDYAREKAARRGLPAAKADNVIQEVVLVRDYKQQLESVVELASLKQANDIAQYKGKVGAVRRGPPFCCKKDLIEEKITALEEATKAISDEKELPVLRAFAILNSPLDVDNLLHAYRFSRTPFRCCLPSELRFEGKAMRVQSSPEPSDIIWANQDTPKCRRFVRKTVMFSTWVIVMVISVALVYMTEHSGRQLGPDAGEQVIGDSQSCDAGTRTSGYVCNAIAAVEWTREYARSLPEGSDERNCYCTTQGYQEIVQDGELRDELCREWLVESGLTVATTFGTAGIIIAINFVLKELVNMFAAWEKPVSLSELNSSVLFKVSVSQIINTSLIIFVINFHGFFLTKMFNMEGDYSDFDRGWYATVASAILTNMVVNAFFAPLSSFSGWAMAKIKRCWCCRRRAGHQYELLQLYENPPFEIAERYAQMLTTAYCTMIYSSGLPLLNLFAVIYFFLSYWCDRLILFRGSKTPPAYNLSMPKQASSMLLYAAPLHAIFALFMYSHPCTFPSGAVFGDVSFEGEDYASGGLKERVRRRSSWMMLLGLGLMVAVYALWWLEFFVGGVFRGCKQACACCCSSDPKVVPVDEEAESELTWDLARPYIARIRPPATYQMTRHPDFEPLIKYFKKAGSCEPEDLNK